MSTLPQTRGYQQEMLKESLHQNIIIALDTGSGKTHIAILRMRIEAERELKKISWFLAPTVALCEQQCSVISAALPVSVGKISGSLEPNQWKDASLWHNVLTTHRIMVSTPQVLLDALRHGYIHLGADIGLMIFDEAHHAVDNHPYNRIMAEFYFHYPPRQDAVARGSNMASVEVRPMILGLTASPIYGGDVIKAFHALERNLDCVIRAPQRSRSELADFVHRPQFRHLLYPLSEKDFSTNLASLEFVLSELNIEDDPYVKSLRAKLQKLPPHSDDRHRIDQKLSKAILQGATYTHKGLRDFARSADAILVDIGSWAADWYIEKVMEQARLAVDPYQKIITTWQNNEKAYLLDILSRVVTTPVSYYPEDLIDGSSSKVQALIQCLLAEKADTEAQNEAYSSLIFVERRDSVLALEAVLAYHPDTADIFKTGCLLGTSESAYRHSFLDITRKLLRQTQEETLEAFKIGEIDVIISTSVAEEGIDIQSCGSVIRWDVPPNMASWAQSRGRARRKRSTFTLMFEDGGAHRNDVAKWEALEQQMVQLYNSDRQRDNRPLANEDDLSEEDDNELELRIPSTGALLTLHSAVSHLSHFCAVMPNASHLDHRPLYDLYPPDFPEGWHSFDGRPTIPLPQGPFASTVTLPKLLDSSLRVFSTKREYKTKISAHRHAAFMAYKALYEAGLLTDGLLPLTSVVEPQLEEEVQNLLKEVEKRASTASVSIQIDPWAPSEGIQVWWSTEVVIDGLPPFRALTRSKPFLWSHEEAPTLHRPTHGPTQVHVQSLGSLELSDSVVEKARLYTRDLFWGVFGSRMDWDDLDFAYLVFPFKFEKQWTARRSWLAALNSSSGRTEADSIFADAESFGSKFGFPSDLTIVRKGVAFSKALHFLRWRQKSLSAEETERFLEEYPECAYDGIDYPLLEVEPLPPRTNFLLPIPPRDSPPGEKPVWHLPRDNSTVVLCSPTEYQYAVLLPSILRFWEMTKTVASLRENLFHDSPLASIPLPLLTTAITAPVSQERTNYQRLETLGDTVLKFVASINLLAQYPLWHEGYLSRKKDHAVSNVRLAKEAVRMELYRWIIRDRLVGKKWKPKYFSSAKEKATEEEQVDKAEVPANGEESRRRAAKDKKREQLSMKVLADVVESLIGAAYLHGGFDLGIDCAELFGLGLVWQKLPQRIDTMLSRVSQADELPNAIGYVETMLDYKFKHKLLLVEALTHASYQEDLRTLSYERMEFLGDSVLDMVVTECLYHSPHAYSPGHIFIRKSALVNSHMLAFFCLQHSLELDAILYKADLQGNVSTIPDKQRIHLWQCLLHSSSRILDDLTNTFARYKRVREEIETALSTGPIFPWSALTRLQAPKFISDMVESLLGAVYLDSHGDLDVIRDVLRHLGYMQVLERAVREKEFDVKHPASILSLWAQKHDRELEYVFEKEQGLVSCAILVDGKEEVRVIDHYRGHASQNEVKFIAAEKAIVQLRLRDVGPQTQKSNRTKAPKRRSSRRK